MKLAIMQPYFLPYIGYFQLISAVDVFVVYDNIQYTKKGWINRNRMLQNGKNVMFSLQLKKDSDYLDVLERELSVDFNRTKLLNKFKGAYTKAPYFKKVLPLLESILLHEDNNLFRYIHHSLIQLCCHLGIDTEIRISSSLPIEHSLKGQEKVLALCERMEASTYINAIGGQELYSKDDFAQHDIALQFLRIKPFTYLQFGAGFVPWLSIIDVLMFNSLEHIQQHLLNQYELA